MGDMSPCRHGGHVGYCNKCNEPKTCARKSFCYFTPSTWSKKTRHAFILTLPISGPLWIASIIAGVTCGMAIFLIALPIMTIYQMWSEE